MRRLAFRGCSAAASSSMTRPVSASHPLPDGSFSLSRRVATKEESLSVRDEESACNITREITSLLGGNHNQAKSHDSARGVEVDNILSVSWFSNTSSGLLQKKREAKKERKAKWIIKNTQTRRFDRLLRMCAQKLGTDSTFNILSKLGRETGIKECNSLISLYIDEAKKSKNKEEALYQIQKLTDLYKFINEKGLQFEEETYRPLFTYLIDMKRVQEFQFFIDLIMKGNSSTATRLGYYEMLLYIKIGDKGKIQDLWNRIKLANDEDGYGVAENYLLAFCDTDSKMEISQFLETFGIRRLSSLTHATTVFHSLGRLCLENFVEDFVLVLQRTAMTKEDISSLICGYITCLPNLSVEEIVLKFRFLHHSLKLIPCADSYEKLITFFCKASEVNAAVDVVTQMFDSGLAPSSKIFDFILWTLEHNGEFDLVHTIYSLMQQINVVPEECTIRMFINLFTRMRDFERAHDLLEDLKKMKKRPTVGMYNALMAGHFRENDIHGALMVLKLMENASVERDAETFSYLITNCTCEEQIEKYYEEMELCGIKATRQVFMALINAFANVGRFDKAKEIVLDKTVPDKHLNEIKSVLISALATNGEVNSALDVYYEMKQAGCNPQAKAICTVVEYTRSEGKIEILLQLLQELSGSKYWFDASGRVVQYCIRYSILNIAADLLKQMKEADEIGVCSIIDQAFSQLWEKEPPSLEFGLQLLQTVKELGLCSSRASLDFLLSSCIKARDLQSAQIIWSEYSKSGLPYNVLTFLRMYQVLLASCEFHEAKKLLKRIPKDDPHVCLVLRACETIYNPPR